MQYYEKYVVIERLRKKVTCGEINLPYGTECYTIYHGDEKAIMCDKGLVCYISSKTAYKHFAQNDDGNGLERGRLTKSIIARLDRKEYDNGQHQKFAKSINVQNIMTVGFGIMIFIMRLYSISSILLNW